MAVNFLEMIAGTGVDLSGFEEGARKLEQQAEDVAKSVAGKFGAMGVGIATAIAGTVLVALEKAIHTTIEWGEEMEELSHRMGMAGQEAATLVGILERYGIQAGIAARAMGILAVQIRQTTEAADPFKTKLGQMLGSLRDVNGNVMSMSQIFDLARQKVQGARTELEKLEVAQSLVGARMAGHLLEVLKMSNAEFDKQKAAVEGSLGPVDKAIDAAQQYRIAMSSLQQEFRGIQVAIGAELLPTLTEWIRDMVDGVHSLREWYKESETVRVGVEAIATAIKIATAPITLLKEGFEEFMYMVLKAGEYLHIVEKGTADIYKQMEGIRREAHAKEAADRAAAEALGQEAEAMELTEKKAEQLAKLSSERVKLAEQAKALGLAGASEAEQAVRAKIGELENQRQLLEKNLSSLTGDNPEVARQRLAVENEIQKNRVEAAQTVAKLASDQYKDEELHLKAVGALNTATEIELLQKKLSDERIVGDERLKIEGDLYQKRTQFAEQSLKVARDLGFANIDQEIAYRKQKSAQALGSGDVIGAAQELVKARELAIQQADAVMEFTKKLRVVSIQDEIDFNRQKLELVKGNAEEEMKVISKIADLDKQMYSQRLEFGLNYTNGIVGQYNKIMDAAKKSGETETFERARIESERQLVDATREAGGVLRGGGGTAEQREAAVGFAQFVNKQIEQMQSLGKEVSGVWRDAASTAKDILKAASGGEEVRAPGGPSPTIGSLMSPAEGLATEGLARGSDIPRLDTSFTDLAIRVRDVLLGTIPNIQNFSNQLAAANSKIAAITGAPINPGAVGPGGGVSTLPTQGSGQLATGIGTPAPTVAPGAQPVSPTSAVGIGTGGLDQLGSIVGRFNDAVEALLSGQKDIGDQLQSQSAANAQQLADAVSQALSQRQGQTVSISIEPGTGDLIVNRITQELTTP